MLNTTQETTIQKVNSLHEQETRLVELFIKIYNTAVVAMLWLNNPKNKTK